MESFLSAVLGELMTRSINFIINKYSKPPAQAVEKSLQRELLRAQVIIEEAMGRQITNQAMIQQLALLIGTMHQGYYALDTFRYQRDYAEEGKGEAMRRFMPIVGPVRIGKSTLVAHICKDERVHDYFSEILWLHDNDFTDDELGFTKGCAMKHQKHVSNSNKGKRMLVVIELSRSLNEDAWNRMYLASKRSFSSDSKIIVTNRSNNIVKFGTTRALTLKYLSVEAYWYFFKTLTFGSMNPDTHPSLAQLSMEIARTQKRSIFGACITFYLSRNNFDIHFWCKVLNFWRGLVQNHVSKFGVHPSDLLNQNKPVRLGRMAVPPEDLMIRHQYHRSSQEEVPVIKIQDVLYGSIKRHGKFEVLAWRSQIPPY